MAKYEILVRTIKSTYRSEVEADEVNSTADWIMLVKRTETSKDIVFAAPKDSVVYAKVVTAAEA